MKNTTCTRNDSARSDDAWRLVVQAPDGAISTHAWVTDYIAGEAQQRLEYGLGVVCWCARP